MSECVLDASALLALIFDEPGRDRVARTLPGAMISTINLAEVATRLFDVGIPAETVSQIFTELQLSIVPFDADQAMTAASYREPTRSAGLSLGDRACLAVARHLGVPVLMADRAWSDLAGPLALEIVLIRGV
ncbi:MAG: type II toxin-antitoxin system VapC family toxin [Fulvimarina manganoxydans]|uniref:type II toxin-antitoxin system VapC family toxin n=1 Tax=Fulvimarina manganoxydans TaxID=937218 RepID=UPI002356F264|nr:type II toxin-antitoxin system VapC family toxin [Fulvimarina manganoxydans]MCK5930959.1 type II toxin-antitoxin system VapC family toxin [Fulvimarina manganoxydans]